MSVLTVYYSFGGNTRRIAQKIHAELGGDMAEIKTVEPYIGSYDKVVEQGQREVNAGFTPEIQPVGVDIADYDTIIIGTPVWWYTFASAMKTFLESNDCHGKRIFPFATNGGWLGHTPQDFEHACRGAKVANTLNIRFDGSRQMTPRSFVDKLIEAIKQETGGAK